MNRAARRRAMKAADQLLAQHFAEARLRLLMDLQAVLDAYEETHAKGAPHVCPETGQVIPRRRLPNGKNNPAYTRFYRERKAARPRSHETTQTSGQAVNTRESKALAEEVGHD